MELVLPDHESVSQRLVVVAGQRATLDARLQPVATMPTPTPTPMVDTARVYLERDVDTPPKKVSGTASTYRPKLKPGETVSVTVTWVVDEEGRVTDLKVLQSGGKKLDEAYE